MAKPKLDLSIAIPVLNEAHNLPRCLEAIGDDFAKQVVVIDSGSSDETINISQSAGAKTLVFSWDGRSPKKRNWYLRNHTPKTEWVLFLDADEVITASFKNEVCRKLLNTNKVGFWLSYNIYFEGKPLKGGYPLKKLALFRVGSGEYERIDEDHWSDLDMEIHEHPILQGETGRICSKIDHRDFRSLESWRHKHEAYAKWEAQRFLENESNLTLRRQWTLRQKFKYWLLDTNFIAPVFFLGCFVFLGGFLDGTRGYRWSRMKADYFSLVREHINELREDKPLGL